MRTRGRIQSWALVVAAGVVAAVAGAAQAESRLARTCVTTIQTDHGAVKVLRKIGPKQSCQAEETPYAWDRTGFTMLTGGTVRQISVSDGAQYSGPGLGAISADITAVHVPVGGGTLRNLRVRTNSVDFQASTLEVRVVVGFFETPIGCTISGISNFCVDGDSFQVGDGDVVAVKIVETGQAAPAYVNYSLEFAPPLPQ